MVLLTTLLGNKANAQVLDKVAAVVGKNRIILQSEVDAQVASALQNTPEADEAALRCEIMEQMILQKMLVEQAERDSVVVSEEDVEAALDNRVRYFVGMLGSKEKLEEVSGKTIFQLKESYRDMTRENMMAERVQGQLLQSVKITPAEVRAFFNTIPTDSLPYFPAMVEMGQIVINPPTNPELDLYARNKLDGIRKDIVENKKDFEMMASMNSDDPGSRDNGGRYDGVP
jgi:peptidyl-prolyl cis-trans isomerase SurA